MPVHWPADSGSPHRLIASAAKCSSDAPQEDASESRVRQEVRKTTTATAPTSHPGPASAPSAKASADHAGRRVLFAPNVAIDWSQPAVLVATTVVLRDGPLEFAACFAGKEHESILRLDAQAEQVYQALGLIGLTPGRPAEWDEGRRLYHPPEGDLLDIRVLAQDTAAAGGSANAGADSALLGADLSRASDFFEWTIEAEYGQTPVSRPWVFAGSRTGAEGRLVAGLSGAALALVDSPEALVALTRSHSSADAELWLRANPNRIPPDGTRVLLVFTPARARAIQVRMGPRGDLWLDGRLVHVGDLADLVQLSGRLGRATPFTVEVDPATPGAAVRLIEQQVRLQGVAGVEWLRPASRD